MLNALVFGNMRRCLAASSLPKAISSHLQPQTQNLSSLFYSHACPTLFNNLSAASTYTKLWPSFRLLNATGGSRFLWGASNRNGFFVRAQIAKAFQKASRTAMMRVDKKSMAIKPTMPMRQNQTTPPKNTTEQSPAAETASILKRFKDAYKQHGKILIWTHVFTSIGWYTGFFMLAKGGFDITILLSLLEKLHIMTHETATSIVTRIETFSLDTFMREHSFFSYILPEAAVRWLGASLTGKTLQYIITTLVLIKLFTPLRYLVTIGGTNLVIRVFKRRGVIPRQPPVGSSIRELYTEQKYVIRRSLKAQRENYRKRFPKR